MDLRNVPPSANVERRGDLDYYQGWKRQNGFSKNWITQSNKVADQSVTDRNNFVNYAQMYLHMSPDDALELYRRLIGEKNIVIPLQEPNSLDSLVQSMGQSKY